MIYLLITYDLPMIYHYLPMIYYGFTYDFPMIHQWLTMISLPMIYL